MGLISTTPNKFTGTVRMGRASSSHQGDFFRIEIDDEDACLRVIEIKFPMESAGMFISNMEIECDVSLYENINIGMRQETKTARVEGVNSSSDMEKAALKAEEENPGWTADRERYNGHKAGGEGYSFTMRRWVKKEKK